ncbi:MAG: hypothetical protein HY248_04410 [Fimbriimonas ginsengisoli]|nr:hypothetical protein [Fimbriimonas ginsengisoli]
MLMTVTVKPGAAAAWVRLTVQVVDPGVVKLFGLQLSGASEAGPSRFTVVLRVTPFSVAENTAVLSVNTVVVFEPNIPLLAPAPIGNADGTMAAGLVLFSVTVTPPLGAGPVN